MADSTDQATVQLVLTPVTGEALAWTDRGASAKLVTTPAGTEAVAVVSDEDKAKVKLLAKTSEQVYGTSDTDIAQLTLFPSYIFEFRAKIDTFLFGQLRRHYDATVHPRYVGTLDRLERTIGSNVRRRYITKFKGRGLLQ